MQSFTRTQVGKIVQSPALADAWIQANRLAQKELVKALTGEDDGAITVEGDAVSINLAAFRSICLDAVPASVLPHDAAAILYDTIVRFLRARLRTVFVLGLVVAAGAFLTGPSPTASRTRQSLAHGIGWLQRGAEGAGLRTGPVGTWIYANRRVLRIGAVALAGLALVFWSRPTGKVVIGLALVLLVVLAAVEFLARPGQRAAERRQWRGALTRIG